MPLYNQFPQTVKAAGYEPFLLTSENATLELLEKIAEMILKSAHAAGEPEVQSEFIEAFLKQTVQTEHAFVWGVKNQAGDVIASTVLEPISHFFPLVGEVADVYVDPAYQNTGIGTWLMNNLIAQAKQEKFFALGLRVRKNNDGARRLYVRIGFQDLPKSFHNRFYGSRPRQGEMWMRMFLGGEQTHTPLFLLG